MNSSQNSASIDVHTFENCENNFFYTFMSELRVPPSELRIFGRFPGNDNIL
jgi:hypothetical protein